MLSIIEYCGTQRDKQYVFDYGFADEMTKALKADLMLQVDTGNWIELRNTKTNELVHIVQG